MYAVHARYISEPLWATSTLQKMPCLRVGSRLSLCSPSRCSWCDSASAGSAGTEAALCTASCADGRAALPSSEPAPLTAARLVCPGRGTIVKSREPNRRCSPSIASRTDSTPLPQASCSSSCCCACCWSRACAADPACWSFCSRCAAGEVDLPRGDIRPALLAVRASSDSTGLALRLRGGSPASRANAETVTGCAGSLIAVSAGSAAGGTLLGAVEVIRGGGPAGTPARQGQRWSATRQPLSCLCSRYEPCRLQMVDVLSSYTY